MSGQLLSRVAAFVIAVLPLPLQAQTPSVAIYCDPYSIDIDYPSRSVVVAARSGVPNGPYRAIVTDYAISWTHVGAQCYEDRRLACTDITWVVDRSTLMLSIINYGMGNHTTRIACQRRAPAQRQI
jgi:hypothetical protein